MTRELEKSLAAREAWALDLEREWKRLAELGKASGVPRGLRARLAGLNRELRALAREAAPWVCHEVVDLPAPPAKRKKVNGRTT